MYSKAVQMEKLSVQDGGMYTDHDEFYRQQSDGTTIMALKYKGGILLGADSRSSNVSEKSSSPD
jgi:20S proteasome alpha/beta subunit